MSDAPRFVWLDDAPSEAPRNVWITEDDWWGYPDNGGIKYIRTDIAKKWRAAGLTLLAGCEKPGTDLGPAIDAARKALSDE